MPPLTLALAEDSWVAIGIFVVANITGFGGMWMHLHLRIKEIEVRQFDETSHRINGEQTRQRFEERVGSLMERTSDQLRETTKRLDLLIARMEEREKFERS